ncbi:type II toxin-antitoxin system VapB family antitoxin [Mesorhizobium sp. J428]|uniref:type II toxin-antitoxin system VapB family antitoxin n=1 Tax=Mesorhizobium sp. J428 TaxID=2898440 RepID=UPI0021517B1D|nr:type II toxin-antitoxin system VapB family antitoxin [Mesorhizobium sp. J428]MCR5857819.1 type II toxin-antitoxin system VapB family antitoxin [Mesorhizobium sp. J428]
MGLNIKNERVEKLAKEVAGETGETLTAAIQVALEERLARLHRNRDIEERRRRIREIVQSFGPVPEGVTSDHSDLYDEWGLPK